MGKLEYLNIEGIYTHIDSGRVDHETMDNQLIRFQEVVGMLRAVEYKFDLIHTTGSAGALHFPESRMSMVRCGLAIYGLQVEADRPLPDGLRPALSWKTSVVQVKRVSAGTLVGMGGALTATKALTLAVLPVGFMDGFRRDPKHWGEVLVKGERAPIFGQVGMYQTLIDVSQIDDVRVGDEVVLIGQQGDQRIRLEDVAERLGVSIYEIISLLMRHGGH